MLSGFKLSNPNTILFVHQLDWKYSFWIKSVYEKRTMEFHFFYAQCAINIYFCIAGARELKWEWEQTKMREKIGGYVFKCIAYFPIWESVSL